MLSKAQGESNASVRAQHNHYTLTSIHKPPTKQAFLVGLIEQHAIAKIKSILKHALVTHCKATIKNATHCSSKLIDRQAPKIAKNKITPRNTEQ